MSDPDNPNHNHVTFHLVVEGVKQEASGVGPARAVDCVGSIWAAVSKEGGLRAADVCEIYSEWEPAPEDMDFLDRTFPEDAQLGFTFRRPAHGQWEAAVREAAKVIRASSDKH